MGKGDKKSKKGKLWMGTYGVRRRRKNTKVAAVAPVAATKLASKAAK